MNRTSGTNPRLAVVIGTFAAVPYVHLQLEARRRLFPGVPLLVHDDASPAAGTEAIVFFFPRHQPRIRLSFSRLPSIPFAAL